MTSGTIDAVAHYLCIWASLHRENSKAGKVRLLYSRREPAASSYTERSVCSTNSSYGSGLLLK